MFAPQTKNRSRAPVVKINLYLPIELRASYLIRPGFHQRRRRLNHFYVEPPECFHRDFASKSASDVTDASAQNYNLDARINATPLVETGPIL